MGLRIEPSEYERAFVFPRKPRMVGWYWIMACLVSVTLWVSNCGVHRLASLGCYRVQRCGTVLGPYHLRRSEAGQGLDQQPTHAEGEKPEPSERQRRAERDDSHAQPP